ncbi:MAG TPA: GNAT family N-acetyltransferase [Steroidobacteraceae bacterium]|nr:GNAT family N-acetyltransferase [Steroidobacteraceae bacterium]
MPRPDHLTLRAGRASDAAAIRDLYIAVASSSGSLARAPDEMTGEYVASCIRASLADGVLLVAELAGLDGIAGELHAYRNGLKRFAHVLGSLTAAVHPDAQGRGIGRALLEALIDEVRRARPAIDRIELISSESNVRARKLYESLGFRAEGRFERGIVSPTGQLESDIPMAWLRRDT